MRRPPNVTRRPPSYPIRTRLWRLTVSGIAEARRMREDAAPDPIDDEPATVAIPYESIAEASREAHARLFPIETNNEERSAA